MASQRFLLAMTAAVVVSALLPSGRAESSAAIQDAKATTPVAISGCLMRQGYATFVVADARLDAIGDKVATLTTNVPSGTDKPARPPSGPAKWVLDDAGNVGVHVGEKVQVIGRSESTPAELEALASAAQTSGPGPAAPLPHLTVQSLKVLASSCS